MPGIKRAQQRPAKGIADDDSIVAAQPLAGFHCLFGVEVVAGDGHHRAAARQRADRDDHAGAVHQWRQHQTAVAATAMADVVELVGKTVGRITTRVGRGAHVAPHGGLFPHYPLGHAGGAAGIDEQHVAGVVILRRQRGAGCGDRIEILCEIGGFAADLKVELCLQPVADAGHQRREFGIEDHHGGGTVVEDVEQFLAGVAIVDVDMHQPRLEAGDGGFKIGRRVAHQMGDTVSRHRAGSVGSGGDCAGPCIEIAPGRDLVAMNGGRQIGVDRRADG